jgi:hypothetical protein
MKVSAQVKHTLESGVIAPVPGLPKKAQARIVVKEVNRGKTPTVRLAFIVNNNGRAFQIRNAMLCDSPGLRFGGNDTFVMALRRKFYVEERRENKTIDRVEGHFDVTFDGRFILVMEKASA